MSNLIKILKAEKIVEFKVVSGYAYYRFIRKTDGKASKIYVKKVW